MKFIARNSRFIIAGLALMVAFVLSVQFGDRGWQFDLEEGGTSALAGPEPKATYNLAGAKILNKVLLQLNEKYVDPTRMDPNRMLTHGLDELQKAVPEVVVTFDRDIDDNPTVATVQADGAKKSFRIGKLGSLWDMSFKLKEIFRFLQDNLTESEDLKFNELEYAAINGVLNTLDPHSMLLAPEIYKEMQTQTGGKFGGLGIVIGIRNNFLTVISPMEGTPAWRAGIKSGDQIMRINEESTINMSLNDAVSKLRGDPGTRVTIWVERKGWNEPKPIEITRAIIKIESVESHLLANKVGYVKIKNFQANTHGDLKKALDQLSRKSGGLSGVVLDLRNNPGGLLEQAIKVSDTFLNEGTIVSTVGFGNKLRDENKATKRGTEPAYPIVVLVDPGSASASEIVSGALKNHDRAVIVGNTTFGKGSVQVIYELSDGSALKLTIAQYLTPGDVSIQGTGITPDMQLVPVTVDDKGVDMYLSNRITREADLDAHLDHSNVRKSDKPLSNVRYYFERPPERDPNDIQDADKFEEDFGIRFAQRLIKTAGTTWKRPDMLRRIEPTLMQVSGEEMKKITAELAKQGVDWSEGESDSSPTLKATVTTSADQNFKAGEEVSLTLAVENTGDGTVYRLRAVSECDNDVFDDKEFIFGKIGPGETRSWTTKIEVPEHMGTRADFINFKFGALGTDIKYSPRERVEIEGKKRPHFAFTYFVDDAKKGNGDGILQAGEEVDLHLHVTNTGEGDAGKTIAYLRNLNDSALFLKTGRVETEAIKAGEREVFDFAFEVKAVPDEGELKLDVEIFDEVYKEFTSKKVILRGSSDGAVQKASGTFKAARATPVLATSWDQSPVVATLASGAKANVLGKVGDLLRIQLDKGTYGFVKSADGAVSGGRGPAKAQFSLEVVRSSPVVTMAKPTAITDKAVFNLAGQATDNGKVRDYYVFNYTRKDKNRVDARKIVYKKGGAETVKIDADVPLKPGMNRIRVYVRDNDDMVSSQTVYVFRTQ